MKRVYLLLGVTLVVFAYLVTLAFFAPRQVYVFMLVPSPISAGYAFAKKKARAVRWTPKTGQDGSLDQTQENDSNVEEETSTQCPV